MKTFSEEYLEHADLPEPDDGGGDGEEREDSAQQDADLPLQLRVLVPLLLALGSLLLRAQSPSTHQALPCTGIVKGSLHRMILAQFWATPELAKTAFGPPPPY